MYMFHPWSETNIVTNVHHSIITHTYMYARTHAHTPPQPTYTQHTHTHTHTHTQTRMPLHAESHKWVPPACYIQLVKSLPKSRCHQVIECPTESPFAACHHSCWQQLRKPKYIPDILPKIVSNMVSFMTFLPRQVIVLHGKKKKLTLQFSRTL